MGQFIFACFFGLIGTFNNSSGSESSAISARDAALLVCGNASGVVGWLCFVALGAAGGEASSFAPLVSLYVFVPIIFAVAGGERPSVLAFVGMCIGAAGGVILARAQVPPASSDAALAQRAEQAAPDAFTNVTSHATPAAGGEGQETMAIAEMATLTPRALRIKINEAGGV